MKEYVSLIYCQAFFGRSVSIQHCACRWGHLDDASRQDQATSVTLPLSNFIEMQAEIESGRKAKRKVRQRKINAIYAYELQEALGIEAK
jgi:hypothetical protein